MNRHPRALCLLLLLALLLAPIGQAQAASDSSSGFPYQELDIASEMPRCYNYRYTSADSTWNCGVVTSGNPFLRLILMGTGGGNIFISLSVENDDTNAEAEQIDFTIDGYTYTVSLTELARTKELNGFWIYSTNFAIVEALAKGQNIALSAVFSGVRHDIPLDEDTCKALRTLCTILVRNNVLAYLSDTYSEKNVSVADSFMNYSVREAGSAAASFPDEALFTEFERSRIMESLAGYSAQELFSSDALRADLTIFLMLDLVLATRMSVADNKYSFHWRDDSYAGLLNDQELIVAFLSDAKPDLRNTVLFIRHNVATGAGSYRLVELDAEKAPGFMAGYLAALCGQDKYAFNTLSNLNAAIDIINQTTGLSL